LTHLPLRFGLALLLACLLLSNSASATRQAANQPGAQDLAEAHYQRGISAYRAGRYQEAIEEFLAAEREVPSPRLAFNVALAYEHLKRPARALEYFRDYLRRGPEPDNAARVERRVAELASLLGEQGVEQLTVRSHPTGATLMIDGTARGSTPWTGELALGAHRVSVQYDGYVGREQAIELGDEQAIDVELQLTPRAVPPPEVGTQQIDPHDRRPLREDEPGRGVWRWAVVGAGGAALVGAGVFEVLRRDAQSDARNATYQLEWVEARDSAEDYQTTARILAGVGGLLTIGGAVLLWVDAERDARAPAVGFGCDAKTCLGTWSGRF